MAVSLAAKGVLAAATSKTGRKALGIVAAVVAAVILAPSAILSGCLSIFSTEKLGSSFNGQETAAYQTVRGYYEEYADAQKEEMQALAEKYHWENMVQDIELVIEYNPETGEYEEREIRGAAYCKADITVSPYQYLNTVYAMAYLTCRHRTDYMKKDVKISKKELFSFWDSVTSGVLVDKGGTEDAPVYRIYNTVLGYDEILNRFFPTEQERQEYRNTVYMLSQYIGAESFGNGGTGTSITPQSFPIPLYYQYAAAWGSKPYGNGTLSQNGCAPACIAMVFSYLTGREIHPDDVAAFTGNRYYVSGDGSSWEIFGACAAHWGVQCTAIAPTADAIAQALSAGRPVILSVGPGTFTSSGHFIVLTGIDAAGQVTVNDPNDNGRKNFKDKKFPLTQLAGEAKGGWSFE